MGIDGQALIGIAGAMSGVFPGRIASLLSRETRFAGQYLARLMAGLALFLGFVFLGFKLWVYCFYLGHAPHGLGTWLVLYENQKSLGWGPGANESGILVYSMSGHASNSIRTYGIDYLKGLPRPEGDSSRGYYRDWNQTPFTTGDCRIETASLREFMGRYGLSLDIDPEIAALFEQALAQPGSYYACGRGSVLILMPEKDRIIFAYSG